MNHDNPKTVTSRRTALATAGIAMLGVSLFSQSKAAESTRSASDHRLNVRSLTAKSDAKTDDANALIRATRPAR